ncbi:hypothetical protein SNE40_019928 [Patella caerulea]|uniref:Uncharacterized protein n=1 Tax=Patella caerulea TaxID=87958 RepID=A0AAN8G6E3_PATCE
MEGKAYTCASKPRKGRMVEPQKCTDQCLNPVTTRKCHIITEEDRQQMFSLFWSMTWDEKKIWVSNMIDRRTVQEQSTIEPDEANYRKKYSYYYFLNKDGERVPVCKHLFLSTLCIGEKSVYKWIDKLKSDPSS